MRKHLAPVLHNTKATNVDSVDLVDLYSASQVSRKRNQVDVDDKSLESIIGGHVSFGKCLPVGNFHFGSREREGCRAGKNVGYDVILVSSLRGTYARPAMKRDASRHIRA